MRLKLLYQLENKEQELKSGSNSNYNYSKSALKKLSQLKHFLL